MKKFFKFFIFIIISVCLIMFANNNYLQTAILSVNSKKIKTQARILHISDTHEKTFLFNNSYLLYKIKKINPDIIIHTGDFINITEDLEPSINLLTQISQIAPVYIVQGNHDVKRWKEFKESIKNIENVYVLDNKEIYLEEYNINLIGLTNSFSEEVKYIQKNNIDENKYNICLIHKADHFKFLKTNKFDYFLSGHTHGGQWKIPFVGGLVSPERTLFPGYNYGKQYINETDGYVNRGLGGSQTRLNNFPELTVIDFVPSK